MMKRVVLWGSFLSVLMVAGGSRTVDPLNLGHFEDFTGVKPLPGQVIIRELVWQADDDILATLETSDGFHQVRIDCESGSTPHQLKTIVPGTDRQTQVMQNICHGKLG